MSGCAAIVARDIRSRLGNMWHDLLHLDISVLDKVIRTIAVYAVLVALIRLAGKRDLAQLNSMDLVVMLLLSNVVQNAIIGPDNSLVGGVIGAAVLLLANALLVRITQSNEKVARVLEGTPTVLAEHGQWEDEQLRRVGVRKADVEAALRRQGADGIQEIDQLTLEPGGAIVARLKLGEQNASVDDILRLEAKLDELLSR
jgi:uncharacterized membrane protein YcaP (DUF421 family)